MVPSLGSRLQRGGLAHPIQGLYICDRGTPDFGQHPDLLCDCWHWQCLLISVSLPSSDSSGVPFPAVDRPKGHAFLSRPDPVGLNRPYGTASVSDHDLGWLSLGFS